MDEVTTAWLELKARFEALAAKHRHYVEFFERATEAYLITDTEGSIQEANGAAVRALRRRKRGPRARPPAALVAPAQPARLRRQPHALAAGDPAAARSRRTIGRAPA